MLDFGRVMPPEAPPEEKAHMVSLSLSLLFFLSFSHFIHFFFTEK